MRLHARFVGVGTVAIAGVLGSCGYLKDRGADLADPLRAGVGAGTVGGVRGECLGLVDTGFMFGVKPRATSIGWRYGDPAMFDIQDDRLDADQAVLIMTTSMVGLDINDGSYDSAKNSAAILPAVFSWVDRTPTDYEWRVPEDQDEFADQHWIWSAEGFAHNRAAQIHAFDIEAELGLVVYLDLGISPGELVDLLLGLVLIDIAKDDGRW